MIEWLLEQDGETLLLTAANILMGVLVFEILMVKLRNL